MAVVHVYALQPGHLARFDVPRCAANPKGSLILEQWLPLPPGSAALPEKIAKGWVIAFVDFTADRLVGWAKLLDINIINGDDYCMMWAIIVIWACTGAA